MNGHAGIKATTWSREVTWPELPGWGRFIRGCFQAKKYPPKAVESNMLSCIIPHLKWSSLGEVDVAITLFQGQHWGGRDGLPTLWQNISTWLHYKPGYPTRTFHSLKGQTEHFIITCVHTEQHWMKRPSQNPSWPLETQNFVANWKFTFASPLFSSWRAPGQVKVPCFKRGSEGLTISFGNKTHSLFLS